MKSILEKKIPAEIEILTEANKINEYMMTRLRTKWGIELSKIRQSFNELGLEFPQTTLTQWQNTGLASELNDHLILTDKGSLVADKLASDLFIV
jgi:oxygen-independent coproporphyrinogen-3 oxidase